MQFEKMSVFSFMFADIHLYVQTNNSFAIAMSKILGVEELARSQRKDLQDN